MDNWVILKDAANLDAAYNFMNYILDPAVSAKEIAFHGYNTAVLGSRELLPADTQFLDMVYFTDEEVEPDARRRRSTTRTRSSTSTTR